MSFSEFYQRSINEPEAFWAEQAGVSTGDSRLRRRWIIAVHRLPAGFAAAPLTYVITPLTAGWINSRRRWR